jgi:hypothetical protein
MPNIKTALLALLAIVSTRLGIVEGLLRRGDIDQALHTTRNLKSIVDATIADQNKPEAALTFSAAVSRARSSEDTKSRVLSNPSSTPAEVFPTAAANFQAYPMAAANGVVPMTMHLMGPNGNISPTNSLFGQVRNVKLGKPISLTAGHELGIVVTNAKVLVVQYTNSKGEWVRFNYITPPKALIDPSISTYAVRRSVGVYVTASWLPNQVLLGSDNALVLHNALQAGKNPKQGYMDRRPGTIVAKVYSGVGVAQPNPAGFANPRVFSDLVAGWNGKPPFDFNSDTGLQWAIDPSGSDSRLDSKVAKEFKSGVTVQIGTDGQVYTVESHPRAGLRVLKSKA